MEPVQMNPRLHDRRNAGLPGVALSGLLSGPGLLLSGRAQMAILASGAGGVPVRAQGVLVNTACRSLPITPHALSTLATDGYDAGANHHFCSV
jgi:hypothetical protein